MEQIQDSRVEVYRWQNGVHYDLNTFSAELLDSCLQHFHTNTHPKTRITIRGVGEVRLEIMQSSIFIRHFQIYESGHGSDILTQIENSSRQNNYSEIVIWIGTKEGTDKTKSFLKKNGYSNITLDDDGAHGETFSAEKKL